VDSTRAIEVDRQLVGAHQGDTELVYEPFALGRRQYGKRESDAIHYDLKAAEGKSDAVAQTMDL